MGKTKIEGVQIINLKAIEDERGFIKHMLRKDDPHFTGFGEIYFSGIRAGAVKAWHLHRRMTLRYVCISGFVEVGLIDIRFHSPTNLETMRVVLDAYDLYGMLIIPPGVLNGFRCLKDVDSILANCADMPHDPDEIVRLPPDSFKQYYDWGEYEVGG